VLVFYRIAPTEGVVSHQVGDITRMQPSPANVPRLQSDIATGTRASRAWIADVATLPGGDPALNRIDAQLRQVGAIELRMFADLESGVLQGKPALVLRSQKDRQRAALLLGAAIAANGRLYRQLGGNGTFLSHPEYVEALAKAHAGSAANSAPAAP
jgi:hypothetical protein